MDGSHGKLLFGVQGCAASSASASVCVWALLPHPRSVKLGRDAASMVQTVVLHLISHYQGSLTNYYSYVLQENLGWMVGPSPHRARGWMLVILVGPLHIRMFCNLHPLNLMLLIAKREGSI